MSKGVELNTDYIKIGQPVVCGNFFNGRLLWATNQHAFHAWRTFGCAKSFYLVGREWLGTISIKN